MTEETQVNENAEQSLGESALNDLLYTDAGYSGLTYADKECSLFSIVAEGKEVIRIENDGRTFWRGREIETDDDFRAAMLDLVAELFKINRCV